MALTKIPSELSSTTGIVDNSNATAITIDSNENVGIGTSSPTRDLHIHNTTQPYFHMTSGDTGSTASDGFSIIVEDNTNDVLLNQRENANIRTFVNGSERMRIDASGNVSIGTSATSAPLRVNVGTDQNCAINTSGGNPRITAFNDAVTASVPLGFNGSILKFETGGTERMRIDASGRVTTPSQPHIYGSPRHTTNNGYANAFATSSYSRNTLSFANSKITVPVGGIYLINFQTISSNGTGRVDAYVTVNGVTVTSALTATNDSGFRQRAMSIVLSLSANDYIQFYNADWYNFGSTSVDVWRTASVTLIG